MKNLALAAWLLTLTTLVFADSFPTGTWIRRNPPEGAPISLTVDAVGSGRKLTYKLAPGNPTGVTVMTLVTQLDGKDADVLSDGKPTGQTMAIKAVDSRHATAVIKFQGKLGLTYKSELSADGRVLKVENIGPSGEVVMVEIWDKK